MKTLVYRDQDWPAALDIAEPTKLNLISFQDFVGQEMVVKVRSGASLVAAFADFSSGEGKLTVRVELEEGASLEWHLASLSSGSDQKVFDISAYHLAPSSTAVVSNYGIAKNGGRLTFTGVSKIERGAKGSDTRQEAKIIVFDAGSDGKCSPVLKIDENDVNASHGASVGRLNDDHLFYLLSRGLAEDEARRLITMGYLKPVLIYFDDQGLKQELNKAIEERL